MRRKKLKNFAPKPFKEWMTLTEWRKIKREDRKSLLELIRFQNKMLKKHPKGFTSDEDWQTMNEEIDYLKSIGEH